MDRPPIRVSLILVVVVCLLVLILYFTGGSGGSDSLETNKERMALLQERIQDYYAEEGTAPEKLADLGLAGKDAGILDDAWGKPFLYKVTGERASIGTLGSDGRKGGGNPFTEDTYKRFPLKRPQPEEGARGRDD